MFSISVSTKEEERLVLKGIIEYNSSKLPFEGKSPFEPLNRVIKDLNGNVIGGVNSVLNLYFKTLYIDILWVDESLRENGHGSSLLKEIERVGKERGCNLAHLETMDFQAKGFYEKNGYEVFGELDNVPDGHKRYYMRKIL